MSWLDQIEENRRERCAKIKSALSPSFGRLFAYGESPSQETLDKAREDMIAKAIEAGVNEEEAIIIVNEIMKRRR